MSKSAYQKSDYFDSGLTLTPSESRTYWRTLISDLPDKPRNVKTRCLLHDGKDRNFSIDVDTGKWYCHSQCGRGGDIYEFELLLNGGSFVDAKRRVFEIIGRPLDAAKRTEEPHSADEWRRARAYAKRALEIKDGARGSLLLRLTRLTLTRLTLVDHLQKPGTWNVDRWRSIDEKIDDQMLELQDAIVKISDTSLDQIAAASLALQRRKAPVA